MLYIRRDRVPYNYWVVFFFVFYFLLLKFAFPVLNLNREHHYKNFKQELTLTPAIISSNCNINIVNNILLQRSA